MFYSEKENWVFIHIPKNAGTSFIALAMQGRGKHSRPLFEGNGSPHHNKYAFFEKEGLLEGRDVFAFVRNPWSRALSLYLFTMKHCLETNPNHHARLVLQGFKNAWMEDGFFCREIWDRKSLRQWNNSDLQVSWLKDEFGRIRTKWYKIETDMAEVEERFECDMDVRADRTATAHGDYRAYYDGELRERIRDLFREDIETFGYEF